MNIAQGSLEECFYYLILAQDLGYGSNDSFMRQIEETSRMLDAYLKRILSSDS